jgi:uncharacterized membrane protein YraQ (UPF0718 family)
MFTPSSQSKLDVLESKLGIYEQLSREMLDKLELAVNKISESNQRIATILAKHDERIEQSIKTDELIIKMIDEVKTNNEKEHSSVIKRIEGLEDKVDELFKFRWQTAGVSALAVFLVGIIATVVPTYLTSSGGADRIERAK